MTRIEQKDALLLIQKVSALLSIAQMDITRAEICCYQSAPFPAGRTGSVILHMGQGTVLSLVLIENEKSAA